MRKDYQNQEIDTSQPAVPDTVSVALAAHLRLLADPVRVADRRAPW